MKKFFILPLLLCLLLSACTLDRRVNMQNANNSVYNIDNINKDVEEDSKEDISDDSTQVDEVQSDISSISFENLTEKQKKQLTKQLKKIFANYYGVDKSEFTSDIIQQKLQEVANYGLIYEENEDVKLNEQAIVNLIDIFTDGLVMKSLQENK